MPDRYLVQLHTAVASNTGGPYTATWHAAVVPAAGVVRSVTATAQSVTSNARVSTVDIYRQADSPAAGSNTATSILASPMSLLLDRKAAYGSIADSGYTLAAGDVLQLRTSTDNAGAKPAFANLTATIEIERVG